MIHVTTYGGGLSETDFNALMAQINAQTSSNIQAYALAWTQPATVNCQSITNAISRGYDATACASTCGFGAQGYNPMFNTNTHQPLNDLGFRPSMILAGLTLADSEALIDRGVASDGTFPSGSAYIFDTFDQTRNLRAINFANGYSGGDGSNYDPYSITGYVESPYINDQLILGDSISNKTDIMFYFTGLPGLEPPHMTSNTSFPGAFGDDLTSGSGVFTSTGILLTMKQLKLTGSFGTVSEPCAYPQKFVDPRTLMQRYTHGDTMIEAQWKSVEITFQGQFVGEPLAAPYRTSP
jgi:uncharacterized protein (TIGR03790 family)